MYPVPATQYLPLRSGGWGLRFVFLLLMLLAACAPQVEETAIALLPIRILNAERVENAVLALGQTQPWQFIGVAGDAVQITADGMALVLQGAQGNTLAQGTGIVTATLPANGLYSVLVSAADAVSYAIELRINSSVDLATATAPPDTPASTITATLSPTPPYYAELGDLIGTLRGGDTLNGTFALSDERHVYTFDGSAGQYIQLDAQPTSGSVDPRIMLYAPDGSALAADDNSAGAGQARLRNIRLDEDGAYAVQVSGGGRGSYRLSLLSFTLPLAVTPTVITLPSNTPIPPLITPTVGAAQSGERLRDHVPVIGSIERSGDFDRYPIEARAGAVLTIGTRPFDEGALRLRMEVYDPLGAQIASAESANTPEALVGALLVPETGTYLVFVTGLDGTTGDYLLSYGEGFSRQDEWRGLTTADQLYAGEIGQRGLRDVWALDLNAGDVISAAAGALDLNLDPVLELAAPDGTVLASDDNSGGRLDSLIGSLAVTVSGRYTLRVTAANALSAGGYNLVWRYINRTLTATPPPPSILLMRFDDRAEAESYQTYPFQGEAGMQVYIQVVAADGSALDPVAVLFGPDGAEVARGDDSPGDLNPRFTTDLPADGTYTVRVNGYLSSGDFTLTVEALLR
jgi:hypothetical protein